MASNPLIKKIFQPVLRLVIYYYTLQCSSAKFIYYFKFDLINKMKHRHY